MDLFNHTPSRSRGAVLAAVDVLYGVGKTVTFRVEVAHFMRYAIRRLTHCASLSATDR